MQLMHMLLVWSGYVLSGQVLSHCDRYRYVPFTHAVQMVFDVQAKQTLSHLVQALTVKLLKYPEGHSCKHWS